ncbi:FHA domain-containing protein [Pseudarthrobacter sulfonivorans]|uniref:FHA domain-containing protein n=1 Tax=Pseudarthrobacter sulfonivorans TaxID=121292 RepID=UPI0021044EAB|nr:FHA domain-containing protein [Pseudarthrobacter sulfonivorans]
MATANYTAGTWLGIVRPRTAVFLGPGFLGPGSAPALVQTLWELLEDAPEVHEVLHAVTSSFGVSLAKIPSFGIVDFRDGLRVFLRGDLDLTVQLPGGPVDVNGRDVTTWTERRLDLPEWYRLTVAGGDGTGTGLPLTEGVVLMQSMTVAVTDTPAATHEAAVAEPAVALQLAAPEPAVAPEREPAGAPEPAVAPEPAAAPAPEVSAETVLGLMDDDSHYAAEAVEPGGEAPADSSPDVEPASPEDHEPAHDLTGTYDHLWEKTVMRRIEDAAVRDEPDVSSAGAALHAAAPEPEAKAPEAAAATAMTDAPVEAVPVAAKPVPDAPAVKTLIDSVPWRTGGKGVPSAPSPSSFTPPGSPLPAAAVNAIVVPGTAVPVSAIPATDPAPDHDSFDGDHDGQTIMKSGLAGLGAHTAAGQEPAQDPVPGAVPFVLALVCDRGHANPPTHAQCAACGGTLPPDAIQVARPRLGRMRVSTGELVDLDQSLVIGRQPSVSRVQGGVMPRLIQVSSPGGDISRSHVEVRLEGWHVMLCDLKATNGTVLVREGQQPRRLAQNEMAILLDGDIAELGDDISLRFEEIL